MRNIILLSIIIMLTCLTEIVYGQHSIITIPAKDASLIDKIVGKNRKELSTPDLTLIGEYSLIFWVDTDLVWVDKYKGKYYSNWPYKVKLDADKAQVTIYKMQNGVYRVVYYRKDEPHFKIDFKSI